MSGKAENLYFTQYLEVKDSFAMPLKIKIFFSLLEHCYKKNITAQASKDLERKYKKFITAFKHQTSEEKAHFLCETVRQVRTQLGQNITEEKNSNSSDGVDQIKEIETTCKMKDTFMGVSVWERMNFKFNRKALRIRLNDNKRDFCLKIPHYFVRKSQKHPNTLVFDAIFDGVETKRQQLYISFQNKILAQEVYQHIFSAVVQYTAQQLRKLLSQKEALEDSMETTGNMNKVNQILTPKIINDYFQLRDKILLKLQNCSYSFQYVELGISDLKIGKSLEKNKERIKLQKMFNEPFYVISKRISLLSRKEDKRLIQFQTLEKFSQNISANYFKYKFKEHTFEFLVIIEECYKDGEQTLIFKGIDNFINGQFVDFLCLKLSEVGKEACSLKLLGIFNSRSKDKQVNVDFLLNLIDTQETDSTNSGNMDDEQKEDRSSEGKNTNSGEEEGEVEGEDNFQTVRSMEDQEPKLYRDFSELEKSIKFSKQQSTTSNAENLKKVYLQEPTEKTENYLVEHPIFLDWKIYKKGGVICINQSEIEEQKKVFKNIAAQIGSNLWARKNILNISMPVTIFRKQSHLKTVARNFSYTPMFLDNVAQASPLERIKKVTLLQISMATLTISMNKPFNPVIGQTYQGLIDGCPIYFEQTCHHPPISVFQFYGRGYKMHGIIQPKISFGLNCIRGWNPHKIFVDFDDGQTLQFTINKLVINGMIFGDRTFNYEDTNYVVDHKNHLVSEIVYGKNSHSVFKGKHQTSESISAIIYQMNENKPIQTQHFKKASKKSVSIFEGIWHSEIKNDNEKVIDFRQNLPHALVDHEFPLPSDCTFREDVIELVKGNVAKSQKQKDYIEDFQRRDKKLREEYAKANK